MAIMGMGPFRVVIIKSVLPSPANNFSSYCAFSISRLPLSRLIHAQRKARTHSRSFYLFLLPYESSLHSLPCFFRFPFIPSPRLDPITAPSVPTCSIDRCRLVIVALPSLRFHAYLPLHTFLSHPGKWHMRKITTGYQSNVEYTTN